MGYSKAINLWTGFLFGNRGASYANIDEYFIHGHNVLDLFFELLPDIDKNIKQIPVNDHSTVNFA